MNDTAISRDENIAALTFNLSTDEIKHNKLYAKVTDNQGFPAWVQFCIQVADLFTAAEQGADELNYSDGYDWMQATSILAHSILSAQETSREGLEQLCKDAIEQAKY